MSGAMSGPRAVRSSGAEQAREEALVGSNDAGDRLRLRGRVPLIDLERSAEDDAVGSREHVFGAAGERVADLRLRFEDRQLCAGRVEAVVVEQVAVSKARGVDDQAFGQPRN